MDGQGRTGVNPNRVTLLADVAEIVSRSHDLDETLSNVVDLVAKRLDADVCSLYLTGTNLKLLTLSATVGLRRDAVGNVHLHFGEGLVGLAASSSAPVVTDHASLHPHYRYFPETGEEEFEGLMMVPLLVQGTPLGVLGVQTREPRQFESSDVETLQTCAQLIAPVVMNARLMALVDQTDEETQQAVIGELAAAGIPVVGSGSASDERQKDFRGSSAARGIAIGRVYRFADPLDLAHLDYTPNQSLEGEEHDLVLALQEARRELDDTRDDPRRALWSRVRRGLHDPTSRSSRTRASYRSCATKCVARATPSKPCAR